MPSEFAAALLASVEPFVEPFPQVIVKFENEGVAASSLRSLEVRVLSCEPITGADGYFDKAITEDVYPRFAVVIDVHLGRYSKKYQMSRRIKAAGGILFFQSTIASTAGCRAKLQLVFATESQTLETEELELVLAPSPESARVAYIDGLVDQITDLANESPPTSATPELHEFLVTQRTLPPRWLPVEDCFRFDVTLNVECNGAPLALKLNEPTFARVCLSSMQQVLPITHDERAAILRSGVVDGFAQPTNATYDIVAAEWGDGLVRRADCSLRAATFILSTRKVIGVHADIFGGSSFQGELDNLQPPGPKKCIPVNELDDLIRRVITNYIALATGPLRMRFPLLAEIDIGGTDGLYVLKKSDPPTCLIGGPGRVAAAHKSISVKLPLLSKERWEGPGDMLYPLRVAIYEAVDASDEMFLASHHAPGRIDLAKFLKKLGKGGTAQ